MNTANKHQPSAPSFSKHDFIWPTELPTESESGPLSPKKQLSDSGQDNCYQDHSFGAYYYTNKSRSNEFSVFQDSLIAPSAESYNNAGEKVILSKPPNWSYSHQMNSDQVYDDCNFMIANNSSKCLRNERSVTSSSVMTACNSSTASCSAIAPGIISIVAEVLQDPGSNALAEVHNLENNASVRDISLERQTSMDYDSEWHTTDSVYNPSDNSFIKHSASSPKTQDSTIGSFKPFHHGGLNYSCPNSQPDATNHHPSHNGTDRGTTRPLDHGGLNFSNPNDQSYSTNHCPSYSEPERGTTRPLDHGGLNFSNPNDQSYSTNHCPSYNEPESGTTRPLDHGGLNFSNPNDQSYSTNHCPSYSETERGTTRPLDHGGLNFSNPNDQSYSTNHCPSYSETERGTTRPLDHGGLNFSNPNDQSYSTNHCPSYSETERGTTRPLDHGGLNFSNPNDQSYSTNHCPSYSETERGTTRPLDHGGLNFSNPNDQSYSTNHCPSYSEPERGTTRPLDHGGLNFSNPNDQSYSTNHCPSYSETERGTTRPLDHGGLNFSNPNDQSYSTNHCPSYSEPERGTTRPLDHGGLNFSNPNDQSYSTNHCPSYNETESGTTRPLDHGGLNFSNPNDQSYSTNHCPSYNETESGTSRPLDHGGLNYNDQSSSTNHQACYNETECNSRPLDHVGLTKDQSYQTNHHPSSNETKNGVSSLMETSPWPDRLLLCSNFLTPHLQAFTPAGQAYKIDCLKSQPQSFKRPIDMDMWYAATLVNSNTAHSEIERGFFLPDSLDQSRENNFGELLSNNLLKLEEWNSKKNPFLKHDLLFLENEFWVCELNRIIERYFFTHPKVVETCLDELLKREISFINIYRQPQLLRSLKKVMRLDQHILLAKVTKLFEKLKDIFKKSGRNTVTDHYISRRINEQKNYENTTTFEWIFLRDSKPLKGKGKTKSKNQNVSSLKKDKKSQTPTSTTCESTRMNNSDISLDESLPEVQGPICVNLSSDQTSIIIDPPPNGEKNYSTNMLLKHSDFIWGDIRAANEEGSYIHNQLQKYTSSNVTQCNKTKNEAALPSMSNESEESHVHNQLETDIEPNKTQCGETKKGTALASKPDESDSQLAESEERTQTSNFGFTSPCSSPRLVICSSPLSNN